MQKGDIVRALLWGPGWLMTPEKLNRLITLCGGECSEVQRAQRELRQPISLIGMQFNAKDMYLIGAYQVENFADLERKLGLFEKGPAFRSRESAPSSPKVRALLERYGMIVTPTNSPAPR